MNQKQREYAIKRIDQQKRAALNVIEQKHKKDGYSVSAAIKEITIKDILLEKIDHELIFNFDNYHFSDWVNLRVKHINDTKPSFNEEAYRLESRPIIDKARGVIDQIMLGDAQEALDAINEFAEFLKESEK
jgi:hypothetical protein